MTQRVTTEGSAPPRHPSGSPFTRAIHMGPSIPLSHLASFQNVTEKQKACETDLAKAEPALLAAQEALDTLNKVRAGEGGRIRDQDP